MDSNLKLHDEITCEGGNKHESTDEIYYRDIDKVLVSLFEKFERSDEPIQVDFRKLVDWVPYSDSYTHYIHSYPAKLLKHIPIFFLNSKVLLSNKNSLILDPFCGSGTVMLEALLAGHSAIGCDANPLARLIAKVKTTKIDINEAIVIKAQIIKTAKNIENMFI